MHRWGLWRPSMIEEIVKESFQQWPEDILCWFLLLTISWSIGGIGISFWKCSCTSREGGILLKCQPEGDAMSKGWLVWTHLAVAFPQRDSHTPALSIWDMAHCPPALYMCLVHECKLPEGVEYYLPRYFSIGGYADCHRRHIPPPVNFSPWMKCAQFKSFEIVGRIRLANIIVSLGHANTEGWSNKKQRLGGPSVEVEEVEWSHGDGLGFRV